MLLGLLLASAIPLMAQGFAVGPLQYKDPQNRFALELEGSWLNLEESELTGVANYVEVNKQAILSIHVRPVTPPIELKAAAQQDAARWTAQKNFKKTAEEERTEGGRTWLLQKATYIYVDEELEEESPVAVRLIHGVFGTAHVTIALHGGMDAQATLDALALEVGKKLRALGAPAQQGQQAGRDSADSPGVANKEATTTGLVPPLGPFKPEPGAIVLAPFPASFKTPPNWRIGQQARETAMLVSNTEPGVIFVNAGLYDSFDACYNALSNTFREIQCTAQATEGPRSENMAGMQGTFASYIGQDAQGNPIAVRFRAVHTGRGIGIGIVALTTPEMIGRLAPRVDEIARSLKAGEFVPDRQAMAQLVGQWARHRGSTSGSLSGPTGGTSSSAFSTYTFNPDGTFSYSFESSLSVASSVGLEGNQATLFSASNDSDQGRYFVAQGVLILSSAKCGSRTLDARLEGQYLRIGDVVYVR
ncbi:MAG: hypothetical protein AB1486_16630 [Planctomycetota bacterium]